MSDLKRVWIVTGNLDYEGTICTRVAGSEKKAEDIQIEISNQYVYDFTELKEFVVEY